LNGFLRNFIQSPIYGTINLSKYLIIRGPGSVDGIATGYGLDDLGSNPGGAKFSSSLQTGPVAHTCTSTTGTGSFPVVKNDRGFTLTPQALLVPWSRKSRAIPVLPLRAVQTVQNLSACTRVQFTFAFF
jgi:hypothetical protein